MPMHVKNQKKIFKKNQSFWNDWQCSIRMITEIISEDVFRIHRKFQINGSLFLTVLITHQKNMSILNDMLWQTKGQSRLNLPGIVYTNMGTSSLYNGLIVV